MFRDYQRRHEADRKLVSLSTISLEFLNQAPYSNIMTTQRTSTDLVAANVRIRALEHVSKCCAEFNRAMQARDAISGCATEAWRLAHAAARTAGIAKDNAYEHAYQVGAMSRPYWR